MAHLFSLGDQLRRDGGFILVVVLLFIAIIALIAVAFTRSTQAYLRGQSTRHILGQLEHYSDAGVNLAALDLMTIRDDPRHANVFTPNGSPYICRLDEQTGLIIRVQATTGLLNINLADAELIAAVLIAIPFEPFSTTTARLVPGADSSPEGAIDAECGPPATHRFRSTRPFRRSATTARP